LLPVPEVLRIGARIGQLEQGPAAAETRRTLENRRRSCAAQRSPSRSAWGTIDD
jgi:hypothetical protein